VQLKLNQAASTIKLEMVRNATKPHWWPGDHRGDCCTPQSL